MSKYIIARDGKCVLSLLDNCKGGLTNGHLNSRAFYNTRWDEGNCFCQCSGHNMSHEYDSHPFNSWFIDNFGLEKWEELHRKSKIVGEYASVQGDIKIMEWITYYKDKLENL